MKKKQELNYLDRIPAINLENWSEGEDGTVILHIRHKGWVIGLVAWLFKRSKVTNIPLDEVSAAAWKFMDGERTIKEIGDLLFVEFDEKVAPVYERLSLLVRYMSGQGWIQLS